MSGERDLLVRLAEGPVSGDALARAVGQTRAAVWKRIDALRTAGIAIAASPGRGYRLEQPLDLPQRYAGGRARVLDGSLAGLDHRIERAAGTTLLLEERLAADLGRCPSPRCKLLSLNNIGKHRKCIYTLLSL